MLPPDLPLDDDPRQPRAERIVRAMHRHLAHRLNDVPASWFGLAVEPMAPSGIAQRVAERCFGDASLVYDVTQRLTEPGIHDARHALGGAPPAFEAPPGETLARFIATRGRGVIVFDDLQAFPASAIEMLAEIADTGRACAEGTASPTLHASRFAILAFARVPLPSPAALARLAGQAAPWPPGPWCPVDLGALARLLAADAFPQHFDDAVRWRFGRVNLSLVWDRYCALLARGDAHTPLLVPPRDAPRMAARPAPDARDLVADLAAIAPLPPHENRFDVFISYSWSHTAADAEWLRDHLRARGFEVFFDKDHLDVSGVPDGEVKQVLIQRLRAIVEASRAWVIFAISLRTFEPHEGMTRDEALRRGLAMRLDEMFGTVVAWSWQHLETRHMGRRIVIGETEAYVMDARGQLDTGFGHPKIPTREAMAAQVMRYLDEQGVQPFA